MKGGAAPPRRAVHVPDQRLYYDDSYTTEFTAQVVETGRFKGRPAVRLESTYFYPESGGQEADRGVIGGAQVLDVQADEDEAVWHVIGGEAQGEQAARVDWTRRFDLMQQHTGQHVLSAALERMLDAPTLSSHLGEERCTLEIGRAQITWREVERLEEAANRVLWEDRPVLRHWTDAEGVKRFALRKPPQVTGRIRIVEIPDWDLSACGGTHTARTGEVGLVKVLRWEPVRGNVRLEFLCGGRAQRDYAWRTEALVEAARRRTMKDRDLLAHLERALEEREELKKQLREVGERLLATEARELLAASSAGGVARFDESRPRDELRTLALKLLEAGARWVALGAAAPQPALVLARAAALEADLRKLAEELAQRTGAKGGGSPSLITFGAADADKARAAWEWATGRLRELAEGAR
jgi:alanyl-tRNA synthetase